MTEPTPHRTTIDGRDSWLWPDGTVLPVVSGGSDAGPADSPPPGDTAVEGSVAAEGATDEPVLEDLDDATMDARLDAIEAQSQRDPGALQEVKRMRAQLKRQREAQATYAPLQQYQPEDRTFLLEMIQNIEADPGDAAARMMHVVANLYGDNFDAYMESLGFVRADRAQSPAGPQGANGRRGQPSQEELDDADDAGVDLTDPEQLAKFLDDRLEARDAASREEQRFQQQVAKAEKDMIDALKAEGIDDPGSYQALAVLSAAKARHNLNISAAAAELRKQGMLGPKGSPATRPAAAAAPGTPPAGGTPPQGTGTESEQPLTHEQRMKVAADRMRQRMSTGTVPAQ